MKITTGAHRKSILLESIESDDLFFALCEEIRSVYKLWRMVNR